MQFDLTSLLVQLAEALSPFLVALVSWAAYKGAAWLSQRVKHDQAKHALELAAAAVSDVVGAGGFAFQAALREAAADGVVTREEMLAIRSKTIAAAKHQAGAEALRALSKITDNPDEWLWTKIKSQAHASEPPTLLPYDPDGGELLR